jgi:hypothetical protein
MAIGDTNAIIRAYLVSQAALTGLIGVLTPRIYNPRLPEKHILPAISYKTVGGLGKASVPDILSPSIQFDCWSYSPIEARQVWRALYDCLKLLKTQTVTISPNTYSIFYTQEEIHGIDLQDEEIPSYFRVMCQWKITIKSV